MTAADGRVFIECPECAQSVQVVLVEGFTESYTTCVCGTSIRVSKTEQGIKAEVFAKSSHKAIRNG
jgi:hypothetical protein